MSASKRAKLEPSEQQYATGLQPKGSDLHWEIEHEIEYELGNLLNNYKDEVDWKAIKKIVQKKPFTATKEYMYRDSDGCHNGPVLLLHAAIQLNAPIDVKDAIQEAFPDAVKKTETDRELEKLLQNYKYKIDWFAVKRIILRKKYAAMAKYSYKYRDFYDGTEPSIPLFLLHIALKRKAPVELIDILYKAFPNAARERDGCGNNVIHLACRHDESSDALVKLFLNEKTLQQLLQEKNGDGELPLHVVMEAEYSFEPSLELVQLMIDIYPNAVEEGNIDGARPLHSACYWGKSSRIISLLLEKYPEAVEIQKRNGWFPLHIACHRRANCGVVALLLKSYPQAIDELDNDMQTPFCLFKKTKSRPCFDCDDGVDTSTMLSGIEKLVRKWNIEEFEAREVIDDFEWIKWWDGIPLALDILRPSIVSILVESIDIKAVPKLLSALGRHCKIRTMWNVLKNRQDILKIG